MIGFEAAAQRFGPRLELDCFVELTNRLAEMTGARVEARFARLFLKLADTVMSRWGKDDIVRTEKDSFVLIDKDALEELASS